MFRTDQKCVRLPLWKRNQRRSRRPRVEQLEDRHLLAAVSLFSVDTPLDVVDATDGLTSLREAISAANLAPGPDEIVFDLAHDGPATILLEHGELKISEALSIIGDGPDLLTIDAQQQSRIFNFTAAAGDLTIAGMTLTGGQTISEMVPLDDTTYHGGAIRSGSRGDLSIENSVISGNSVQGPGTVQLGTQGGGIFAEGQVNLNSSTVTNNAAEGLGGGIRAAGNVSVTQSTIARNSATGGFIKYGFAGGGISAGGNVTVSGSSISDNTADGSGGGIKAGGDVLVNGSTIDGNSAGNISSGGGISAGRNVTVVASTISGNSADGLGGGIFAGEKVAVISSTVTGNLSEGGYNPGGFCDGPVYPPPPPGGGGIRSGSDLTIRNSIVAGNTFQGRAGDLYIGRGTPDVDHSLIGTAKDVRLAEAPLGSPDANGNLIGGVHGSINPMLAPLADNGGPTKTHALLPGSSAIDAGDPTAVAGVVGVPEFEQRGAAFARVSGGRIDMGAYEVPVIAPVVVQIEPVLAGDYNQDGAVSAADYGIWRQSFGSTVTPFSGADGNGDGMVDAADYRVWRANYGAKLASPGASAANENAALDLEARDAAFSE